MALNLRDERIMHAPSIKSEHCIFCGAMATEQHHVVYRSHGGADGPTISVCGRGNTTGCHSLLHSHRLHLDWDGEWKYIRTDEPMSDFEADKLEGWTYFRETEARPFIPATADWEGDDYMAGFNLPDDFDERRFSDVWERPDWRPCEDCEYYRELTRGELVVEICTVPGEEVDFIPPERGCEL